MGADRSASLSVTLAGVTLDCADPRRLAHFYGRLLGWSDVVQDTDAWVSIKERSGPMHISCQREDVYRPPVWPSTPDQPQMMSHLDIRVSDLEQRARWLSSWGSTDGLATSAKRPGVRRSGGSPVLPLRGVAGRRLTSAP
jgi:Glyoxalase-like domain